MSSVFMLSILQKHSQDGLQGEGVHLLQPPAPPPPPNAVSEVVVLVVTVKDNSFSLNFKSHSFSLIYYVIYLVSHFRLKCLKCFNKQSLPSLN